jgi:hypothetical protein
MSHKDEDWTQEKIRSQRSMFDEERLSEFLWTKLAKNLLYSSKNNSIVKKFAEYKMQHLSD